MNHTFAIGLVFVGLIGGMLQAAEKKFNMGVTLDGVKLGRYISGPSVSVADLKNRVVLLEFWGTRCPPCLASLPHLAAWQKQYRDQGLIIVGTEAQNSSDEAIKNVVAAKGVNFTMVAGSHVAGGDDFSGIPHCMLFDHTGKCLYRGSPFQVEDQLKQALQKFTAYGNQQLESALAKKVQEPYACWMMIQQLALSYRGTDLGKSADRQLTALSKDLVFMSEIKAQEILAQVRSLESRLKGEDPRATAYQDLNKDLLAKMADGLAGIRTQYSETKAAGEATEIAKKYGML